MIRFTAAARTGLFLTIAASFLAMTPPAFAADDDAVPQSVLNVAHTDFTSAKSVAQLKQHVRHVAYGICTADSDGRALMSTDQRKCYETAMRSGLAQIETKRVAALRQSSPALASAQLLERATH